MASPKTDIRPPAVAGLFYPAGTDALRAAVAGHLDNDRWPRPVPDSPPRAIIVPHAGYVYSGDVAGAAYRLLRPFGARFDRVLLIGPAHRVPVAGAALSSARAFRTPLGEVAVDRAAVADLARLEGVVVDDDAHAREHSLEVHLPFLQSVLGSFAIVPVVVGHDQAAAGRALDAMAGDARTLIVVSSDLSHYLPYEQARAVDGRTGDAITSLQSQAIGPDQACGRAAVAGMIDLAAAQGLKAETVALCNSGDTAGDRASVVGYGAWAFA